jgi:hypothetical protein
VVSGRLVSVGAAAALLIGLAGAIIVACYDVPRPDCGFVCGPQSACPDGYTCADDHYCHRAGTPSDLVCTRPDAAVPIDAAVDAAVDGGGDARPDDAMPDAPDAMPDAPDAMPDAPIDAPIDAMPDAPDAMPDAPDAMGPP